MVRRAGGGGTSSATTMIGARAWRLQLVTATSSTEQQMARMLEGTR
jgi:hypothetical protein